MLLRPQPGFAVVEATDAWLRGRRAQRSDVVGKSFLDLVEKARSPGVAEALARVAATGAPDQLNAPIRAEDGSLYGIVHRDEALEEELLHSAHERDEALRRLEAAKREIEAFAHSASHDLRSPLRAIGGYCALLRNLDPGSLPPIANDLVARIDKGTRGMASILDGLLALLTVDQARMVRRRVDLSAVAWRGAKDLQYREPGRAVKLAIAEGLQAAADERLVSLAIENLIANAWKYTAPRKSARIEFGCRRVVGQEVFYVSDNGVGFDAAHAQKLFTPFYRMHSSAQFEGHGMGLATVRRVVERHGGQVWAESQPEMGTTIKFTLGGGAPGG